MSCLLSFPHGGLFPCAVSFEILSLFPVSLYLGQPPRSSLCTCFSRASSRWLCLVAWGCHCLGLLLRSLAWALHQPIPASSEDRPTAIGSREMCGLFGQRQFSCHLPLSVGRPFFGSPFIRRAVPRDPGFLQRAPLHLPSSCVCCRNSASAPWCRIETQRQSLEEGGEKKKKGFIALPGKGGHSRLMP